MSLQLPVLLGCWKRVRDILTTPMCDGIIRYCACPKDSRVTVSKSTYGLTFLFRIAFFLKEGISIMIKRDSLSMDK